MHYFHSVGKAFKIASIFMTSIIWTPLCYKEFGPSLQCFGDVTDLVNKSGLLEKNQGEGEVI